MHDHHLNNLMSTLSKSDLPSLVEIWPVVLENKIEMQNVNIEITHGAQVTGKLTSTFNSEELNIIILLHNRLFYFNQICHKESLGEVDSSLFKWRVFFLEEIIEKYWAKLQRLLSKNTSSRKHWSVLTNLDTLLFK